MALIRQRQPRLNTYASLHQALILNHSNPKERCRTILTRKSLVDILLPADDVGVDPAATYKKNLLDAILCTLRTEIITSFPFVTVADILLTTDPKWYENPYFFASSLIALNFLLRLPKGSAEVRRGLRLLRAFIFSLLDGIRQTLFHEIWHALALDYTLEFADPRIFIRPGVVIYHGVTQWETNSTLSLAGEALGLDDSHALVDIMGTGGFLLSSYLSLIIAQFFTEDYPEARAFIRGTTLLTLLRHAHYAYTAIGDCAGETQHDFCNLKDQGYSPISAISFMLGTMLLLQLLLSATDIGIKSMMNKSKRRSENFFNLNAMEEGCSSEEAISSNMRI